MIPAFSFAVDQKILSVIFPVKNSQSPNPGHPMDTLLKKVRLIRYTSLQPHNRIIYKYSDLKMWQ